LRASQLAAKELAYLVLQPETESRARLCQLMKQLGFVQPPNRVLVVELEPADAAGPPSLASELAFTTALHAIEEVAEKSKQVAMAYLPRHGVCVFFRDLTEGTSAGLRARPLAQKILYEISGRSSIPARIGIGGVKPDWRHLAESYHEARLALTGSTEAIATCAGPAPAISELTAQAEIACRQIAGHRIQDARVTLRALPILANRRLGDQAVADHRNFFASALESLCLTALNTGCERESIARTRTEAQQALGRAATAFDVQALFLEAAEAISEEVRRLLTGKHEKVIDRVRQMLDRQLKQGRQAESVSLAGAAKALGLSTGHLSRTFRRMTGMTFRDYAMSRRIEYASRLLLDPLNNVSAVSDRCGFTTPAYFARVFRKYFGCSPTAYTNDPRSTAAMVPPRQQKICSTAEIS
jgi:AraC-like DNA-binding protein